MIATTGTWCVIRQGGWILATTGDSTGDTTNNILIEEPEPQTWQAAAEEVVQPNEEGAEDATPEEPSAPIPREPQTRLGTEKAGRPCGLSWPITVRARSPPQPDAGSVPRK